MSTSIFDFKLASHEDVVKWVDEMPRDTCIEYLTKYGFDRHTVPTDWRSYYETAELRGFVVEAHCHLNDIKD